MRIAQILLLLLMEEIMHRLLLTGGEGVRVQDLRFRISGLKV